MRETFNNSSNKQIDTAKAKVIQDASRNTLMSPVTDQLARLKKMSSTYKYVSIYLIRH